MIQLNNPKRFLLLAQLPMIVLGFLSLITLQSTINAADNKNARQIEAIESSAFPPIYIFDYRLKSQDRGKQLFDRNIIQKLELNFSYRDPDWFPQLHDIFKTGATIPAKLILKDEIFSSAGVRFKGSSSYYFTPHNGKKSFDITLDTKEKKKRLFGNKKINLNNGFLDPTMIREVLYLWICRHYVPTGRASLMQLTINDESWGVYTAVQQIDSTFFNEWFGNNKGNRWRGILSRDGYSKAPKTYNIAQPFTWQGPQAGNYSGFYELRKQETANAWSSLIEVCRQLQMHSLSELEEKFDSIFAVDNALWMIALENVFMDNDSFLRKGYDYYIYEEPTYGRMYLVQHDGNEAFGTGAKNQWPKGVTFDLDPFFQTDNPNSPLVNRLLEVPAYRQRYLAHMRTIIDEWLDWNILGPVINHLQDLAEPTLNGAAPPLYPLEQFRKNVLHDWNYKVRPSSRMSVNIPGLKPFIQKRRNFLLSHPDISETAPKVKLVEIVNSRPDECIVYSNQNALIKVKIEDGVEVAEVLLHFTSRPYSPFQKLIMFDVGIHDENLVDDNIYYAEMPKFPAGNEIHYYVEVRAANQDLTASFSPPRAELEFYSFAIKPPSANSTKIVINEVKATNRSGIRNPKGKQSDWIEVLNISDSPVSLSGRYLSDDENNPRKWAFPVGTTLLPGKHLLVWADGTQKNDSNLHANFKISKKGEILTLVDSDSNFNHILDRVEIGGFNESDSSFGRSPDGLGEFQRMKPTPGQSNNDNK